MIKSISIRNFCSIDDTQDLSFEISETESLDRSSIRSLDGEYLNLVNCFVGHNSSGKTTTLKAFAFLQWFASDSYHSLKRDAPIPITPHKLSKSKSSSFQTIFTHNEQTFKYKIELNREGVIDEYLGLKKIRGFSYLFKLKRKGKIAQIKIQDLPKLNRDDEGRFEDMKNCSLFSFLQNSGYLKELEFSSLFGSFISNVSEMGRVRDNFFSDFLAISKQMDNDPSLRKSALKQLRQFDFGIADLEIGSIDISDTENESEKYTHPALIVSHASGNRKFKLPLLQESNGTQNTLRILGDILPVLKDGGVVIIDEIESSLHPYISQKIVSLFENRRTNPNLAQLFFSSHNASLLNNRTKTQIFLVEKNAELATDIYRLDDIEGVRNDENFAQKYLAGEYGGVGNIGWM
jgi:hypothetical protein